MPTYEENRAIANKLGEEWANQLEEYNVNVRVMAIEAAIHGVLWDLGGYHNEDKSIYVEEAKIYKRVREHFKCLDAAWKQEED